VALEAADTLLVLVFGVSLRVASLEGASDERPLGNGVFLSQTEHLGVVAERESIDVALVVHGVGLHQGDLGEVRVVVAGYAKEPSDALNSFDLFRGHSSNRVVGLGPGREPGVLVHGATGLRENLGVVGDGSVLLVLLVDRGVLVKMGNDLVKRCRRGYTVVDCFLNVGADLFDSLVNGCLLATVLGKVALIAGPG
jgi:hypothetical protein